MKKTITYVLFGEDTVNRLLNELNSTRSRIKQTLLGSYHQESIVLASDSGQQIAFIRTGEKILAVTYNQSGQRIEVKLEAGDTPDSALAQLAIDNSCSFKKLIQNKVIVSEFNFTNGVISTSGQILEVRLVNQSQNQKTYYFLEIMDNPLISDELQKIIDNVIDQEAFEVDNLIKYVIDCYKKP